MLLHTDLFFPRDWCSRVIPAFFFFNGGLRLFGVWDGVGVLTRERQRESRLTNRDKENLSTNRSKNGKRCDLKKKMCENGYGSTWHV